MTLTRLQNPAYPLLPTPLHTIYIRAKFDCNNISNEGESTDIFIQ